MEHKFAAVFYELDSSLSHLGLNSKDVGHYLSSFLQGSHNLQELMSPRPRVSAATGSCARPSRAARGTGVEL